MKPEHQEPDSVGLPGSNDGGNEETGNDPPSKNQQTIMATIGFLFTTFLAIYQSIQDWDSPKTKIFLLVCSAFGCWALTSYQIQNGKSQTKAAAKAGLLWILVALVICAWWFFSPAKTSDANPDLVPTLAIDSVSETEVGYRYELLNSGNSSAYNIRTDESGARVRHSIIAPPYGWEAELRPGERMNISSPPDAWTGNDPYFSRTLSLSWTDERTNEFHRRFIFRGSRAAVKPGAIFHFEHSGEGTPIESPMEVLRGSLNAPSGMSSFVFFETNTDGTLPNELIQSTNRFLSVDGIDRIVTFWNMTSSNHMDKLSLEFVSNSNIHVVMISWGDEGNWLRVDGKTASSSRSNAPTQ